MKRAFIAITSITILGLFSGCVTRQRHDQPLTLVKVPDKNHAFDGPQKMHPCYIVKTTVASSNLMMTVYVDGEVAKSDVYHVPQGTTVLEAIANAGGFTDHAAPMRIQVKVGDQRYVIPLHRKKSEFRGIGRAWSGEGESDFVLQPGAFVYIPRR